MSKTAKQFFNYAIKASDGDTFRCTTEDAKSAIIKYASYTNDISIGAIMLEKAVKGLNIDESVMLHNSLCLHEKNHIASVHIEHTILYSDDGSTDNDYQLKMC